MQPPFSFSFGPTSLCAEVPSPKKKTWRKKNFVFRGGVCCTKARAYWKWLLPAQYGEQCPLTDARMHYEFKQLQSLH